MMDHKQAIELLPAYLDQELGISDAMAVERHLGNCPECQHEFAEQSGVSAQLKKDAAYFKAPHTSPNASKWPCLRIVLTHRASKVGILIG
jgi:anti-sigma factor RsiW